MSDLVVPAKSRAPQRRAIRRSRLDAVLAEAPSVPLTLVVAPAGSGKTTLLAQYAAQASESGEAVAWYQAERSEAEVGQLIRQLEQSLAQVHPGLTRGSSTGRALAGALSSLLEHPTALLIDDFHLLAAAPAEGALEALLALLPPWVHLVVASRRPPGFNLSRLRVSGQVIEIGPDELRFRAWEVEELFRDLYREPLRPEELAVLARRTNGWAAGLQLFHLATQGKPPAERQRVLQALSKRVRNVREYLARNILDELDFQTRAFLVHTSVLGALSRQLCDELLGSTESERFLVDLERRHLFLSTDDEGLTYKTHEVLRSHLEELLVEEIGETAAWERYHRAGRLLESAGAIAEALYAYCRAEDWLAADRVLAGWGDRVFERPGPWEDHFPAALADHDAWVRLATARRQLAAGHWQAASANYRRGEAEFSGSTAATICRRERFALSGWLDPISGPVVDWPGLLRQALGQDPLAVVQALDAPENRSGPGVTQFVQGWAALVAGHARVAADHLARVNEGGEASSTLSRFAALGQGVAACLLRRPDGPRLAASAVESVESVMAPWMPRLVAGLLSGQARSAAEVLPAVREAATAAGNPWIDAAVDLGAGIVHLDEGRYEPARDVLRRAQESFAALGGRVLAVWAGALESLAWGAFDRAEGARRAAAMAELARTIGCPGALALASRVQGALVGSQPAQALAATLEADGAISLDWLVSSVLGSHRPERESGAVGATPMSAESLAVQCLGGFSIAVDGTSVSTEDLKPRVRALLQVLAINAGRAVHRDELLGALWPEDDARGGVRSLQVAVSAIRQQLERHRGPEAPALIVRRGEGYGLDLIDGRSDVVSFDQAMRSGRQADASGDRSGACDAFGLALETYRGDLLPDVGTAEWVVGPREHYRLAAADAAEYLAASYLEQGQMVAALGACERGLQIDRYRDGLWRTTVAVHDQRGNRAAAAQADRSYRRVLDELGVGD